MTSENERRLILEMIQSGKISADEGLNLLKALEADTPGEADEEGEPDYQAPAGVEQLAELGMPAGPDEAVSDDPGSTHQEQAEAQQVRSSVPPMPDLSRWRRFWMIPLWVGVGVTVLAAYWMYRVQESSGFGLLFLCSWLPFLLGVGLMVIAWQSRTAHWIHIRVQQRENEWPRNIAISFPIPIGLTTWFLRNFKHKIHGLEKTSIDELIVALGSSATPENPLYVEVDDGDEGEKVQVYIG